MIKIENWKCPECGKTGMRDQYDSTLRFCPFCMVSKKSFVKVVVTGEQKWKYEATSGLAGGVQFGYRTCTKCGTSIPCEVAPDAVDRDQTSPCPKCSSVGTPPACGGCKHAEDDFYSCKVSPLIRNAQMGCSEFVRFK